jgi:hypothetical protein
MNRRSFIGTTMLGTALAVAAMPARLAWAIPSPTSTLDAGLTDYLSRHVQWTEDGTASVVDYDAVRRDRSQLQRLLNAFSRVGKEEFDSWPLAARQAFLINAYNVWTLALIADAPADTGSIKDLGGFLQSPWKKAFIPFLGETRSLDDIEHGLLRGAPDFDEPRIHFAVNCASIGCPALRPEAYTADRWDAQLDDQTRRFLRDRTRNRVLQRDPLRIGVSSIFDWYGDDFDSAGGVHGFVARYADALGLTPVEAETARRNEARIEFLDYDWRLNVAASD